MQITNERFVKAKCSFLMPSVSGRPFRLRKITIFGKPVSKTPISLTKLPRMEVLPFKKRSADPSVADFFTKKPGFCWAHLGSDKLQLLPATGCHMHQSELAESDLALQPSKWLLEPASALKISVISVFVGFWKGNKTNFSSGVFGNENASPRQGY